MVNDNSVKSLLSAADVRRFKKTYPKYFSEVLEDDFARSELPSLVRQIELVYRPISVGKSSRYIEGGNIGINRGR